MIFLIGLLTVALVVDCLLLILLVLVQLPKKDAGAGMAFGGAATDALFGAGSGNVLTKVTKWGTVAFFVIAMLLAGLQSYNLHRGSSDFTEKVKEAAAQPAPVKAPAPTETPAPAPAPATVPAAAPAPESVPQK